MVFDVVRSRGYGSSGPKAFPAWGLASPSRVAEQVTQKYDHGEVVNGSRLCVDREEEVLRGDRFTNRTIRNGRLRGGTGDLIDDQERNHTSRNVSEVTMDSRSSWTERESDTALLPKACP